MIVKKALNLSIGAENLGRLCWLRCILTTFESMFFLLASLTFQLSLTGLILALFFNLILISTTTIRLRNGRKVVSEREFFFQLLLDLIGHTILLFFSGGYTTPLVSVYLITISISAALLPRKYGWIITYSAVLFYTSLMKWYLPAGFEADSEHALLHQQMINMHLVGMWITFVLSALLINYFVELMASALRKQQKDIATARERQLRDENILAIAIQAAGAAHELGTPLATMAIILGDLQDEYRDESLTESITLLRKQVNECKKRLQQLVAESQYHGIERIEFQDFLSRVIQNWQLIRPESELQYKKSQWPDSIFILCDLTLYQAISALLDNAEDASPRQVSLSVKSNDKNIAIQIIDKGVSFSQTNKSTGEGSPIETHYHAVESLVSPMVRPYSQKEDGLGLGLLLSQASVERLGGEVHIFRQQAGGTLIEVLLPIAVDCKSNRNE